MAKEVIGGLKEWNMWMDKEIKMVDKEVIKRVEKVAKTTLRDAKQITPIDTGVLKASGTKHITDGGYSFTVHFQAFNSTGDDYAFFVHEGTRYMAARPWLRKAFDKNGRTFQAQMELVVRKIGSRR